MHTYIGSTLKYIRTEKGLKQEEVCRNACSRTFLSRVENSESLPSVFVMSNILNNLNVNFDEFFFLAKMKNKEQNRQKEDICTSFFALRDNYENLDTIIQECSIYLENNTDIFINDLMNIVVVLKEIKIQPSFDFEKSELSVIWNRIEKMNILTLNEIKLVNCILFYFPDDISNNVAQFILKELEKYQNYSHSSQLIMAIYLNISTLFFFNKKYNDAKKILEKVQTYAKKNNRYDILYFSKYRMSIIEHDTLTQIKCRDVLLSLELPVYVNELEYELNYYNTENK